MNDARLVVRNMNQNEVQWAVDWAAKEGWIPGLRDSKAFFAADPQGFFVAELDGVPVGCISAVSYQGQFGFIGLYIVRPEFRCNGYGRELWKAALNRLENQTMGLDGVVAQQDNYRKSGFVLAYRNIRFRDIAKTKSGLPENKEITILPAHQVDLAEIAEWDRLIFPQPRFDFLAQWLTAPGSQTFVAVSDRQVVGYTVGRPCVEGWRVGPLGADRSDIAGQLYDELLSSIPAGESVFIDVPEVNPAALELVAKQGMQPVFETARMYRGPAPYIDTTRLYGVTSLELG